MSADNYGRHSFNGTDSITRISIELGTELRHAEQRASISLESLLSGRVSLHKFTGRHSVSA